MGTYQSKYTGAEIDSKLDTVGQIATSEVLGGIKVGEGLKITEDGVLSALGGSGASQTVLFEGKHLVSAQSVTESGFLSDNIKNYDYITLTTGQEVSSLGLNLRTNTILIDTKTMVENDGGYFQWISNIDSNLITGNSLGYTITGNFGDGTQIGIVDFAKGSSAGSRNHYITRVVGIKLGSSGGSSYTEVDLINEPVEYTLATSLTTINQDLVFNDSVKNYDEIVFVVDVYNTNNNGYYNGIHVSKLTSEITHSGSDSPGKEGDSFYLFIPYYTADNGMNYFQSGVHWKNETTLRVRNTICNSYAYTKFRIKAVKGIKY